MPCSLHCFWRFHWLMLIQNNNLHGRLHKYFVLNATVLQLTESVNALLIELASFIYAYSIRWSCFFHSSMPYWVPCFSLSSLAIVLDIQRSVYGCTTLLARCWSSVIYIFQSFFYSRENSRGKHPYPFTPLCFICSNDAALINAFAMSFGMCLSTLFVMYVK